MIEWDEIKPGKIYLVKYGNRELISKCQCRLGMGFIVTENPRWGDREVGDDQFIRLATDEEVKQWRNRIKKWVLMFVDELCRNEEYYHKEDFKIKGL